MNSDEQSNLQEKLRRVTVGDIQALTEEEIRNVKKNATPEELGIAMRFMLEQNRFADIITYSSTDVWSTAAVVSDSSSPYFYPLIKEKLVLLYNILPYVNEEFLSTMGSFPQ